MRPPIVLSASGDIAIFKDMDSLLRYVEPIDVANGEYVAYDSEGRRVYLQSRKKTTHSLFGLIRDERYTSVIAEEEEEPKHADELCVLLVNALASVDVRETARRRNLRDTLETAIEKFGYTR